MKFLNGCLQYVLREIQPVIFLFKIFSYSSFAFFCDWLKSDKSNIFFLCTDYNTWSNHISGSTQIAAFVFHLWDILNLLFTNCARLPICICGVLPAESIVAPHVSPSHLWDVTLAVVIQVSHGLARDPCGVAILWTTTCKTLCANTQPRFYVVS